MIVPIPEAQPAIGLASQNPASANLKGWLWGFLAVTIWSGYLAYARLGVSTGLAPQDFALLRYGTAGLIMLPILLHRGFSTLAGVGWARGLLLTLLAGPIFIVLGTAGYLYAPLAHGAVVQPGSITLFGFLLAVVVLGDRPGLTRAFGIAIIIGGLFLVAVSGAMTQVSTEIWKGDMLFAVAGLLWALFTIALKRWKVDAITATAIVSCLSAIAVIPLYLSFVGFDRILAQSTPALLTQIVVQGVMSGVIAVIAYVKSVEILGSARAALFPALVPSAAILAGIPVTGELPSLLQLIGVVVVTAGLALASGLVRFPLRKSQPKGI